jgi:MYXO-CTERM domain-containing protein
MFLAGALLAGAAVAASADTTREIGRSQGFTVIRASETYDLAPTREENGVYKLRPTQNEQPGSEQNTVLFFKGTTRALYVSRKSGPINEGTAMQSFPVDDVQCSLSVLDLGVNATDGSFTVARPTTGPGMYDTWATDEEGSEYRNCNKPQLVQINDQVMGLMYNYRPNNQTHRYLKLFDRDGVPIAINGGTKAKIMDKNNDDCDMHQSGAAVARVLPSTTPNRVRLLMWAGCNGNGDDDGWVNEIYVDGTAATGYTTGKLFDISLATREERSRGRITVGDADLDTGLACWTEGNNQPQEEGVWCAGVDLSENGQNGEDADSRLLWKDRIEYRETVLVNGNPVETYAMRMNSTRVMDMNPDGTLRQSGDVLLTWGQNRGRNTDGEKGGQTLGVRAMVIHPTRTGYDTVMPKTTINDLLLGFENTHVSVTDAVFGVGQDVKPGFTMLVGSQNGGLASHAELRTIMYDPTTKSMVNLGQHDMSVSYDRHLYPNYLGQNPNEQGRNFANCDLVQNPFADMPLNHVTYFQACALSGKLPDQPDSAIKLSATLSIFPVAFTDLPAPPGGGWNDGDLPGNDDPMPDPGPGPGSSVGGCSSSGGSNGLMLALGLGLAVTIRRRRK